AVAVAAGSWGALVAFWREKTFQTLAIGVLGIVGFLGALEATRAVLGDSVWLTAFNPFRTLLTVIDPFARDRDPVALRSVIALAGLGLALIGITVWRLRAWNPSRTTYIQPEEETDATSGETRVRHRRIWSNPVIWREIRTRAYGRKVQLIKLVYLLLAAVVAYLVAVDNGDGLIMNRIPPGGLAMVGLSLLSLLLINAQAVTSLTSERDGKTLDLLLATDITSGEFIYGKLGGIAYNTSELIVVPLALAAWQASVGNLLWETFAFLLLGFSILVAFAAMLGLHSSLTFEGSRAAIGNSLGTLFFLFVGIFVFLMLLVEASGSLASQLLSFVVFIGLGSICLWASLTHKNPSPALTLAAGWLPFMTFYSITEFLREGTLSVCLAIVAVYGFTSLAMLVPAVSAFDVALGRTTGDRG
ncbi:MAG: ABC transporter permease, partial [Planctomycetota bacterium]|nr:ABC transporter permease [Planctomycetota bacterium]